MDCIAEESPSAVAEGAENPAGSWTRDEVKAIAGACWQVEPGELWIQRTF
jgi:hypothetical protein